LREDKQEKFTSIGAISFNRQCFLEVDRCPAVVFVGGTAPRCDAFGSAGPWIYLHRPCTFKEAEKCPVRKYNWISKEMLDELHLWLIENKNLAVHPI
jgi:hypothetical protein